MDELIKHQSKIINMFGGPGAGKSTIAAELYAKMKKLGYSVELVGEVAKDLVHEFRMDRLKASQDLISARQNFRQFRILGQYEYIITDSPLLLGIFYTPDDYYPSFKQLVIEKFRSYTNINVYLDREAEYDPRGRYQDEQGAIDKGNEILHYLKYEGIPFLRTPSNDLTVTRVLEYVKAFGTPRQHQYEGMYTVGKYTSPHPKFYGPNGIANFSNSRD